MIKVLRYSFIALLALVCNVSFAGEVTVNFTQLAITATDDGYSLKSGDFTFVAKKESSSTKPTQNSNSKDLRNYAKNTLTISGAKITKMVFTMSAQGLKQWSSITPSVGNITIDKTAGTTTWENAEGATSIVLTVGATNDYGTNTSKTSGQFDINSVIITSDGQGGGTVDPTPDPTPEVTTVANIAAFKALVTGTTANLTLNNAQVVYKNEYTSKNGTNIEYYVRDASGAIQFYNTGLELEEGQILNGTVEVKYNPYNGMPEAVKTANTSLEKLTVGNVETIAPKQVTVSDLTDDTYLCELVQVTANVSILKEGDYTNTYLESDGDQVMFYDKFKKGINPADGSQHTYVGILIAAKLSGKQVIEFAPTAEVLPTGINGVVAETSSNAPAYNLAGQKVSASYKGIVIKNGKKFVQK